MTCSRYALATAATLLLALGTFLAARAVSTDGSAGFTVASSSIGNATNGSPGAYPAIYQGCHWGNCSSGGLSAHPIVVSSLTSGSVTTSWSTT